MNEKKSLHCPNCGASVSPDCVWCTYCRSVLSATSCPRCFAPAFAGMAYCTDCGTAIDRSVVAEKKNLLCPKCAIPMNHVLVGDIPLCECGTCSSLWLDTVTFNALCEENSDQESVLAYDRPMTTTTKGETEQVPWKYRPCPECGELMIRKNFLGCSGIIVDFCKKHGTWFEYRELQRIVQFIQSGGMLKARQKELDKLKEEQKKLKDMTTHNDINNFLLMDNLNVLNKPIDFDPDSDKPLSLYELLVKLFR